MQDIQWEETILINPPLRTRRLERDCQRTTNRLEKMAGQLEKRYCGLKHHKTDMAKSKEQNFNYKLESNRQIADERAELLETIREIVSQEIDAKLQKEMDKMMIKMSKLDNNTKTYEENHNIWVANK